MSVMMSEQDISIQYCLGISIQEIFQEARKQCGTNLEKGYPHVHFEMCSKTD